MAGATAFVHRSYDASRDAGWRALTGDLADADDEPVRAFSELSRSPHASARFVQRELSHSLTRLATAVAIAVFGFFAIILGVLTTGSGPHAGDASAPRNGLNSEVLQHIHSWAAYLTLAATLVLLLAVLFEGTLRLVGSVLALLAVEAGQVVTGIAQSNLGLPPLFVGMHMMLACVFAALTTNVIIVVAGQRTAPALPNSTRPSSTPVTPTSHGDPASSPAFEVLNPRDTPVTTVSRPRSG